MKIIQLPEDDFELLNAAHSICLDAQTALDKAHKTNKTAQADYQKICRQLCSKHKLQDGQASDDQAYLYGQPLKLVAEED